MATVKSNGGQGTAAPVNVFENIKAGTPTDTGSQGAEVKWGEQPGGTGNNDKRAAR
jgi:hypothetical protein